MGTIPYSQALAVCHIGHHEGTCRYLAAGPLTGLECLKLDPADKAEIDRRVKEELWQCIGNHCEGR
jgi:hypothetical protein